MKKIKNRSNYLLKSHGNAGCPRLIVAKSAKHIYAQIINDERGHTLCSASTLDKEIENVSLSKKRNYSNVVYAEKIGKLIALRAKKKNISKVIFDRNSYIYHGKIKILCDACRKYGLIF